MPDEGACDGAVTSVVVGCGATVGAAPDAMGAVAVVEGGRDVAASVVEGAEVVAGPAVAGGAVEATVVSGTEVGGGAVVVVVVESVGGGVWSTVKVKFWGGKSALLTPPTTWTVCIPAATGDGTAKVGAGLAQFELAPTETPSKFTWHGPIAPVTVIVVPAGPCVGEMPKPDEPPPEPAPTGTP